MKNCILIIATLTFFGCGNNNTQNEDYVAFVNYDTLADNSTYKNNTQVDSLFSIKYDSIVHKSLIIDSKKYYIVEGDLLLNEYEYTQYRISLLVPIDSTRLEEKLVGEIRNNKIVKWPQDYVIKFCISKNTFQTLDQYNLVKENMKVATKEWENTCNVRFYYDENKDINNILTPTSDLTFVVMGYNTNSSFIASAFFPYDPPTKRRLLIDPSYFNTSYDKIGVLRHELGHILGFRHEHIRGNVPLICKGESSVGTINITQYDPKSVMHYFCEGIGNIKLEITEIDRQGSQSIYGSPLNN